MVRKVKARFTDGKIEPLEPLDFQEGQEILISVEDPPAPKKSTRKRPKFFTAEDSMWNLMGIGQDDEATDVSQNKHKYLADAYEQKGR